MFFVSRYVPGLPLAVLGFSLLAVGCGTPPTSDLKKEEAVEEISADRSSWSDDYQQAVKQADALEGFKALDAKGYRSGGQEFFVARYTHAKTGLTFHLVPGGSYLRGSPSDEPERGEREGPVKEVSISPFLICATECTQAAWDKIMESNPSSFKGAQRPADKADWTASSQFSKRAGLRLPSETEWEYACRAGTTTPFAFGKTISPDAVNYRGDRPYDGGLEGRNRKQTVNVGSFPPNAFGLYDMHGNVAEWCRDPYAVDYAAHPTDGSAYKRGTGTEVLGTEFVLRGGSWYHEAEYCRSASRRYAVDATEVNWHGFRPAKSLEQP